MWFGLVLDDGDGDVVVVEERLFACGGNFHGFNESRWVGSSEQKQD